MSNARPAGHRLSRRLSVAVLATVSSIASANTYLGGPWNSASSWSDNSVPDRYTYVEFPDTYTGNVDLAAGGAADVVRFQGGTGVHLIGDPGSTLVARTVSVNTGNHSIDVDVLRGAFEYQGYGIIDLNNGTNYWGNADQLHISSTIVDAQDPDDSEAAPSATDVFANGTFSGSLQHTGLTKLFGATRLVGSSGEITASLDITMSRGKVQLDSTDSGLNGNRLPDAAVVHMDGATLELVAPDGEISLHETIDSLEVISGANGIRLEGNISLAFANVSAAMSRSDIERGTLTLEQTNGLLLTPVTPTAPGNVVPYVITNNGGLHLPMYYDAGGDGDRGTEDDLGLQPVDTMNISGALLNAGANALVSNQYLNGMPNGHVNTLTIDFGDLNLGGNTLYVDAGTVVINQAYESATPVLRGAGTLRAPTGQELILFVIDPQTTIACTLGGDNGVTISNVGDLTYGSDNTVTLTAANTYSGPTTFHKGHLVLKNAQAIPSASASLRLVDANVVYDFTPAGAIPTRLILDGDAYSPSGNRDNFLREIKLKDGQTFTFTGGIEGNGAYFVSGANSTMVVDASNGFLASAATDGFSLWPNDSTVELRIDGKLGDEEGSRGSVVQFQGKTTGKGRITGGMQLSGGVLAPGSSGAAGTAVLRMQNLGAFGGEMHFNVNGTGRGTQYDAIDSDTYFYVNEQTKFVVEAGSFVGQLGQRFELVRFFESGSFGGPRPALVNPLATQAGTHWVQIWGQFAYEIAVAGPAGDSNLDGSVNFDDLLLLAQHYNGNGTYLEGDSNNDGLINFDDLLILAQHYGEHLLEAGDASSFDADWALAQSLVPEPSSAALLGLATLALRRRR